MPQGRDMPKADTRYLYKRNGRPTWWIKLRVPGTNETVRHSLKTKDLREAQARRDKLLAQREQLAEKTSYASQLNRLRKEYLASVSDQDREIIKDKIQESADDMVIEMGLQESYWGANEFNPDHMSEEQLKPWKAYKTALGQLTPLNEVVPHWLETIENKRTRADYRRGVEVLQKRFVTIEEIDRVKAKHFLLRAKKEEEVSNPTIQKWMSGYKNLWDYADKEKAIWNNQKLPNEEARPKKQPWEIQQVFEMYQHLSKRNDIVASWLKHAIWIAAHTGSRAGAVSGLKYNAADQTVWLPRQKKETRDRLIPAHSEIIPNLQAWVSGSSRSTTSISNQFSLFKQSLGYDTTQDFHSFRRTFIGLCENSEIPEGVAADICGHKKQTITYGLYSGGTSMARMREAIKKISYG